MQTKIQGMKSPVSCAGLDRITIKGSKSREPFLFAANRMSKCFCLRSPPPLWVLVKTAKWCCASSEDPKPCFHVMDVRANEKRTWKLWQRRVQEEERVGNEARVGNVCVWCSSGLFNQSRVFSTTGQAVEMLWFNNNSPRRSSEDWKRRESNVQGRLVHSSCASASGCMVICNCRPDKSHRGLSADVTGRNRCLIYCHICWAVWRHWSRRLTRGLQSPRGAFASLCTCTSTN